MTGKGILEKLKHIDLGEITKKAELHDQITVKILEIVNEMHNNQIKIMAKLEEIV
uniref:Uncharacterized protein n=1 Tax=viral metagenome TaxID=1070528 RepID=A0A6M3Y052_9ZZZZ